MVRSVTAAARATAVVARATVAWAVAVMVLGTREEEVGGAAPQ